MGIFTGLIDSQMQTYHKEMITEVIRACAVSCTIYYGTTLYSDCTNCVFDPIGNKSSNKYQTGGPAPFTFGNCPMCYGTGKIGTDATETVSLVPIYNFREFIPMSSNVQTPQGMVQTISLWDSTYDEIVQAKYVLLNTDLTNHVKLKFEKVGEPEPCSFGHNEFCLAMWKRIGNG